ncbi:hypothetical protein [Hyphomicrobium sp. D-2]|uniref:hypothetical protein n=1 Tax=Hyphomicrobium sp. D-2 TaxID=3041621 RepID=UPI0024556F1B|nr:hypothetical protein [Hyphomicrobium sp. D-2]MDH4983601.1 hypothetical protein [Hyphomicrobium sp. D-2]
MSAPSLSAQALPVNGSGPQQDTANPIEHLILVRAACAGGASRAQVIRDLAPLFTPKVPSARWRSKADTALTKLMLGGFITEARSKLKLTASGEETVARYFGEKEAHNRTWSEQRDVWLTAKALGVDPRKSAPRSALSRKDGLSALVVQHTFGLSVRQALSPSKLRAALALLALERAFGDNVKDGLGKGSPLSAKAGRVLAGQLLKKPRELPTDARLITALCADQAGSIRYDVESLRLAVLRKLASAEVSKLPRIAERTPLPPPSESFSQSVLQFTPQPEEAPQRPGLSQFSAGVLRAARSNAEGWPGARKAFISKVWDAICTSHPEWGLSEIEFKDMLAGAHRAGQLVLAGADLKDKQNIKEFEDSAILYKNTVWHYVRVED